MTEMVFCKALGISVRQFHNWFGYISGAAKHNKIMLYPYKPAKGQDYGEHPISRGNRYVISDMLRWVRNLNYSVAK